MKPSHQLNPSHQCLLCVFLLAATAAAGCSAHGPIIQEKLQNLGHFEFRNAFESRKGIVIGAPHGKTARGSDRLALAISDRTGAGLVVAYGFNGKRLSVNRPIVASYFSPESVADPLKRATVYRHYADLARAAALNQLTFYIGVHTGPAALSHPIEVICNGLSFEQARAIKTSYTKIRDKIIGSNSLPKLPMRVDPLDEVSWSGDGVKHHGILLAAEKGIMLRQPYLSGNLATLYSEILSQWVEDVLNTVLFASAEMPTSKVSLSRFGRLELIKSRRNIEGVVIGAPHGTFDQHTATMAKQLSLMTGLATVIATGFTPVEANGWRINVNRPTEKTFPSEGLEIHSSRAKETYAKFKSLVLEASAGELELYFDLHQYGGGGSIQVATLGVSRDEARAVKNLYHRISGQVLGHRSDVTTAPLLIEPLDGIEIGAWPAKAEGILRMAKRSLHLEIPQSTLATVESRKAYTQILFGLLQQCLSLFRISSATSLEPVSSSKNSWEQRNPARSRSWKVSR
ncbi:MAG: hypothetical protein ACREQW_25425 [Candidatus Binatia bacterium]